MTIWTDLPEPYSAFSMPEDTDLTGPGVYRWWRSTGESYIGKATSILGRLGDHRRAGMLTVIEGGSIYPTDTADAADSLERALIWLLDPSENIQRPAPSPQLWAATLGQARPIKSWSWSQGCGHVSVAGRCLAEPLDVMRSDCSCTPWLGWFEAARCAAEGMRAQISALAEAAEPGLPAPDPVDVSPAPVVEQDDPDAWAYRRIGELEDQIQHLERLRERADWTA